MTIAAWPLIELDATGVARIEGTPTKVIEIALDRLAHHWDADEIQRQHPHLSLGQIHAALAYYYEHQEQCDRLIDERRRQAYQIRSASVDDTLQTRLRNLARP
ncbi:MAG: DUF433 domain-containing protein [Planctomycetaceae bacterium]